MSVSSDAFGATPMARARTGPGFRDTFDFSTSLRQARAGDGRGHAALFVHFSPRIAAFVAARRVEDPEATTNEVFLRVFQHLDRFRGSEKAFVGWVFRIARNRVIDEHRARQRRVDTVSLEFAPMAEPSRAQVDRWMDDVAAARRTLGLLDHLTDQQREIVLLRVISGLSFAEIGAAVGKRTVAVRATYKRARAELARQLETEASARAS